METKFEAKATLDGLDLIFKKTDASKSHILALRNVTRLDLIHQRKPQNANTGNSFAGTGRDLGRSPTRIEVDGEILGEGAKEVVTDIRKKYLKGDPLDFVYKSSLEAGVAKVLIQELNIASLKGKPNQFQYNMRLVEYTQVR